MRPSETCSLSRLRGKAGVGAVAASVMFGAAAMRFCETPPPPRPSPARAQGREWGGCGFQVAFCVSGCFCVWETACVAEPHTLRVFRRPFFVSSFPRRRESCLGCGGGVFSAFGCGATEIPACAGMTAVGCCGFQAAFQTAFWFSGCLCVCSRVRACGHTPYIIRRLCVGRVGLDPPFSSVSGWWVKTHPTRFAGRALMPDCEYR